MDKFLRKCRRYFAYAFFFSLFINLLMLTLPIYMLQIFDRVITSRSEETLVMLTIAAVAAFFLHMVFEMLRSRLLLGAGLAVDGLAGRPVLNSVLAASMKAGPHNVEAGLRDVAIVRAFLAGNGINALFDSPWVPIFIAVIFMFHPLLGILAVIGAVTLFTLAVVNEKVTREPQERMSKEASRASRYIDAGLRNAEVVGALGMRGNLTRRWQRMNDRVIDAQVTVNRRAGAIGGMTRFFRLSLQILMLAVGATLVIQQHVSPGIMIAGTLILSRALAPIDAAVHSWKSFIDARDSYRRLKALLPTVDEAESGTELPQPKGRVEVERVTFSIPRTDRLIIKGVSFQLEPGEALGLIGPSAAGKSTLARLLVGIWRPNAGAVRLDGADVSTWPRESLGPHLGYLPQDVELFAGTVGENIARLGEADSEAIIRAARRAHAHGLITRLPKAYDPEIGEAGAVLSAGQRPRVALARALFGDPRLVVLDEPNANLDSEGEEALIKTLRELHGEGVTVVVISHRPTILGDMDKLLVLRDGLIEMFGPRDEVMERFMPRQALRRRRQNPAVAMGGERRNRL